MYARHAMSGESIFLGRNSVVAMAAALVKSDKSDTIQGLIGQSILPIFALENDTLTYPFVDIFGTNSETERIQRLCALLPVDSESFGFLRQYRDNAHVLFPAIIDIEQFEAQVIQFLMMRAQASALPPSEQNIYGQNLHWLGLFFACIASGCQCSTIGRKQRQLTSQVYGEISQFALHLLFLILDSLLCVRMLATHQLFILFHAGRHPNPLDTWKCNIKQYERWRGLDAPR